jgi:hypothetical protein
VKCVSKDEVDRHKPPSWFETARALKIRSKRSELLEGRTPPHHEGGSETVAGVDI